jgi:hypothetical protein
VYVIGNRARESWKAKQRTERDTGGLSKWDISGPLKTTKEKQPTTTAAAVRTEPPQVAGAGGVGGLLDEIPVDIRQQLRLTKRLTATLSALEAALWTPADVAELLASSTYASAQNPAAMAVSLLTTAADTATERPSATKRNRYESAEAERIAERERLARLLDYPEAVAITDASDEARQAITQAKQHLASLQGAA